MVRSDVWTSSHNYITPEEQKLIVDFGKNTVFKAAPDWLGKFDMKAFYNRSYQKTPLNNVINKISALLPSQRFNTVFLQRYTQGQFVNRHRDPKNNIGYTLIAVAGEFQGAMSYIDGKHPMAITPGMVLALPCTIDGIQGPRHHVSEVTSGVRYALILNTITG